MKRLEMNGVLLTNTRPPTSREISFWNAKGYSVHYQALLDVKFLTVNPLKINPQAIVLTSANAARALKDSDWDRAIPILCIGKSTAFFAKSAGFLNCFSPTEKQYASALELIKWIQNNLAPKDGPVVFACGEYVRHNVDEILSQYGFDTKKVVVYKTTPVTALDKKIKLLLSNDTIKSVIINSEQTLLAFMELCKKNTIETGDLQILTPSKFIKDCATKLNFQNIFLMR